MHTSLMLIILVSIVVPASDTAPSASENYRISEVIRVLTPDSFECRLSDYKPAPSVRFRVYLPGFGTQNADGRAKELLAERLKSAKQIELRNTKFRSYFRIETDLWIDGKPFWKRPVSAAVGGEKEIDKQLPNSAIYQPATALLRRPSQQPKPPAKQSSLVKIRSATIRELLDTPVDCSMLTEDTPFSEAVAILAESVEPHLPLLILWKDLQANALIEKDTPIGVEGLRELKLRQALNIVLHSVSTNGPDLALVTEGKILTLGTEQTLLKDKITRVYEATDLLAVPSTAGAYNQGGFGHRSRNFGR